MNYMVIFSLSIKIPMIVKESVICPSKIIPKASLKAIFFIANCSVWSGQGLLIVSCYATSYSIAFSSVTEFEV